MTKIPNIDAARIDNLMAEDAIDLRYYWRVLMRFKVGIIGLGLLFAVVGALVSMSMPNIYQSSATVMVESSQLNVTSIEDIYGLEGSRGREYFSTQFELLKSRTLAERVVRELNLLEHPEFAPEPEQTAFDWQSYLPVFVTDLFGNVLSRLPSREESELDLIVAEQAQMTRVLSAFYSRLTITPVNNTNLVNVNFESTDPRLAARVVNTLANTYIENQLEQRMASMQQVNSWMNERLEGLKDDLDESEGELQEFLERENLVNSVEGITALNAQELDQLTAQNVEARRLRQEAGTLYRKAESLRGQPAQQLLEMPQIFNHPSLQRPIENVDGIEREIAELSQRYGRNHPRMIALNSELQEAKGNLERQVQQVLAGIETTYRNALNNEQSTQTRLQMARQDYQDVNRKSSELRELQRAVETNGELYDMFFTRIRETTESSTFQDANAMVVDPGTPAVKPVKPRRKLIVAVAMMAGLMLGTLLAFFRDMLDNTIHSPDDVEERLHTSTLGLVPLAEKKGKSRRDKVTYLGFIDDGKSTFSESIRTLRTSIMLSSLDRPLKVIGVTSSIPNEGKSTLAVNLSAAIGQMHKTLLIDADMRRPSLAKSLGVPLNSPGLSSYVAGTAELTDCFYEYKQGGFFIMPGGQLAPNPLELIASPRFRQMLEELGREFEQIIIDTPPTQAVSDALVIGSYSDATVYVVKSDATPINAISSGLKRLQYANANVLGVVLNQVDVKKDSGYYYGGYYDSYGYSSGGDTA